MRRFVNIHIDGVIIMFEQMQKGARFKIKDVSFLKRVIFSLLILGLLLFSYAPAEANSFGMEIRRDANRLRQVLSGLPYTRQGRGAVIYVFGFSECAFSQKLYHEWQGKTQGIELRHLFYPVSDRSSNETAALSISRDLKDYHAYMQNRKQAPDFRFSNRSTDAYNFMIAAIKEIIPILKKNGWERRGLVSPHYFWEVDGRLYTTAGYTPQHFQAVMRAARSGR